VIPFDRINSAIGSLSSSDIFTPPSLPIAPDGGVCPIGVSRRYGFLCDNFAFSVND
jgi:hypothetical protein